MAGFKTFHDGLVVQPAELAATSDAWHLPPADSAKPVAAPEVQTGARWSKRRGKKAADAAADDGKAGIPGAVFNLANAVRARTR